MVIDHGDHQLVDYTFCIAMYHLEWELCEQMSTMIVVFNGI